MASKLSATNSPDPTVIFLILAGLIIVLSYVLHLLGVSVTYETVNLQTHKVEETTTTVNSLVSGDGVRFMLSTSMVRKFVGFGPVGIILVVMVGVGVAEQAGLMTALIKKIVQVTPRAAITWILVTLGVLSSVASAAGYLVLKFRWEPPPSSASGAARWPGWRRRLPGSRVCSGSIS